MKDERWLILADDLTGAADCAIAFARRGTPAAVVWGAGPHVAAPVLSFNVGSRAMSDVAAGASHADVLARLWKPPTRLYKKIDSMLRGQPAAEIAAVLKTMRTRYGSAVGVCAPAFPAVGRTTRGGRVYVDDRPLDGLNDLRELLANVAATKKIALSAVRGEPAALRQEFEKLAADAEQGMVAICDAQTQDDLDRIAAASLATGDTTFFIGSGGLAHSLARLTLQGEPLVTARTTLARAHRGTLVVVGSLAGASRAAAAALGASEHVHRVTVQPASLLDHARAARTALAEDVAAKLADDLDVLVEVSIDENPDLSISAALATSLGEALAPAARVAGGLAITGGETAAALLASLGVNGIQLADEIEPGICLGITLGAVSLPLVTKSGAFGDAGCLIRICERLRRSRQSGIFE